MLEIDCRKCSNCGEDRCLKYGADPARAVKACAADGFKNYTRGLKPEKYDVDHEYYFTMRYRCPICGAHLASYDYGRAWTAEGLRPDQLIDCPECGQTIDWSDEPKS